MVPILFQFTRNDNALDAGSIFIAISSALVCTIDLDASTSQVYGYTMVLGAEVGVVLQASFSVTQAVVSPENIPSAIGFITQAQFVGIIVALAVANAILLNNIQDKIQKILPNIQSADIQAAILSIHSGLVQSLSPDIQLRYQCNHRLLNEVREIGRSEVAENGIPERFMNRNVEYYAVKTIC
ncbi:hypothetical protein B0O99DRAFT_594416 [Bisporella sp. PMI_857]|nr:hypothetical protein B0O99DRAFT_594416 [Bisporella sp. PMI_857]